jgi:anti-sigma factor RsiW
MDQDLHLPGPHLSVSEIAAYLDGAPLGPDRARVEAHLAWCDACLRDVIAAGRVLRCHRAGHR